MLIALWALPVLGQELTVNATWGCPTADGPLAIAKAFRDGTGEDIGIAAASNNCSPFPYPVPVEPVRFIVETEYDNMFIYVWEAKFTGTDTTFFSNFSPDADEVFRGLLKESSL